MRITVTAAAVGMSIVGLSMADDVHASIKQHTDIPAQSLAPALQSLAKDRNFQIIYVSEEIGDRRTAGAVGEYTPEEALKQLLRGTGLTYKYLDENTVTVVPRDLVSSAAPHPSRGDDNAASGADSKPQEGQSPSLWSRLHLAQSNQGSAQSANPAGPAVNQAPEEGVAVLQEIVVTAQRRQENLQSVPIAVATANAAHLTDLGIQSLTDLSTLAPSVTVVPGIGGGNIAIRGVGGTGSGSDEPANAIYLDGVYQSSPSTMLFALNNVERIEVLKGPQGTLFGRNASGGLINVITRGPQFSPELNATVGYGNYDTLHVDLYGNVPIIADRLAINLAAVWDAPREGWGRNVTNGLEAYKGVDKGVRLRALWNVDDQTSVNFSGFYSLTSPPDTNGGGVLPGTTIATGGFTQPSGFFNTKTDFADLNTSHQQQYSLTIKHEFDPFILTSITARDHIYSSIDRDADASPFPVVTAQITGAADAWTQEFQLASRPSSAIQWALGAFYMDDKLNTSPVHISIIPLGAFLNTYSKADTTSYAGYGQATAPIAKDTKLTAGLRYTADKHDIDFTTGGSPPIPTVVYPQQSVKSDKMTWRLALDHQLTTNLLVYASYSRGFKSGLFNATSPNLPAVKPQTVDAYEIGEKSEWLDGRLRLNADVYFNRVTDLQVKGIPVGFVAPIFYNGASADIKGAEIDLEAAATRHLTLQANLAYTDGHYNDFKNALFIAVPPLPGTGIIGLTGDASGHRLALTPLWEGSVSAQYVQPTSVGEMTLTVAYTFNGRMFYDPQNLVERPVTNIVNATTSWKVTPSFTVQLWGNNLLDKHYYGEVESSPPDSFAYYPAAPRTYGVKLRYQY